MKSKTKKHSWLKWVLGLVLAVGLGAGSWFIYAILPEKVAQSIYDLSLVRPPLTENPGKYHLAYKDVAFTNQDHVTIAGWWLPSPRSKPLGTILLTHGAFRNLDQVLPRAVFLVAQGYQVLMFDFRGQGLSGPSPLSGGVLEAGDYLAAVDYLRKENRLQKPVVFFGFSMGGICALRAANDCPEVEAVVADSPLANLQSYVARRPPGGAFAFFPGFLGRCLAAYDKLAGLSLTPKDLDLVPVVEKLKGIPVLYVTGEKDNLARSEEVRKLFQKTPGRHKRLTYIQDAGHEETYSKFPKIYEKIVSQFLEDLRNGFPKSKDDLFFPKATPVKKP